MPPAVPTHKHACSSCARRKVKCDKAVPCSNCLKAQVQCLYEIPAPPRPRKRAADEHLLIRLTAYEELMRKHGVDFSQCAHTWVPPKLEGLQTPAATTPIASGASVEVAEELKCCLWSNLSQELKYPSIQSLGSKGSIIFNNLSSLQYSLSGFQSPLHELHPEPRQIYRLWQIFAECVNPLVKVVHVPTLQQRILDASWDLKSTTKPLTAMLYAIYTLAVACLSPEECQRSFGKPRDDLLSAYHAATFQALTAADFLTNRDFEVLQAFYLFLLADPESELASTLSGAIVNLGQKMGLHQPNNDTKMPFFHKEMRIRLWWQIRGLDARVRALSTPGRLPSFDFGAVRPPLNVNDADLHPDMATPPVEYSGPTEMLFVLMKLEVCNWLSSSASAAKVFDNIANDPVKREVTMELQDATIDELESIYQEKFLSRCDRRIPLHALGYAMAKLNIARMRFKIHHPRGRPAVSGKEIHMTRSESDTLFHAAVTSVEMIREGLRSKFSSHVFTHLTAHVQLDTFIYMLSELRRRVSGDIVARAWKLVEELYDAHAKFLDTENSLFAAVGDLALEAWEARRKEVVGAEAPRFVRLLWGKRQSENEDEARLSDNHGLDTFGFTGDQLDWEFWNDLMRF